MQETIIFLKDQFGDVGQNLIFNKAEHFLIS